MSYCPNCGTEIESSTRYCPQCGRKVGPKLMTSKKKHGRSIVIIVIAFMLGVGIAFVISQQRPNDSPQRSSDKADTSEVSNILINTDELDTLSNSVVMIKCYDADNNLYSTGSGFIAFESDVVVTNYHVIEQNAYRIDVYSEDGECVSATNVIAYDKEKDLAILRVSQNSNLIPLAFGDSSKLCKGERVIAIGSPLGLINSVSDGIISRFLDDGLNTIQFTAAVSHGSSGGALFNQNGELVGVTYASYEEGQNLNLAIPIDVVKDLWENKCVSDEITIEEFYNLFEHAVTVKEVIQNRAELSGKEIVVKGFISTVYILTYGTSQPQEIRYFLVDSADEVLGGEVIIEDWSTTTSEDEAIADYEENRWRMRESISVIPDEALFSHSIEPGNEVTIRGPVYHLNLYTDVIGYEDDVSMKAIEYIN